MSDLNQLVQRLCDADIEFVIVGGFAAMLHGSSLVTRDLDVCAVLTAENVGRLRDTFRNLHPVHRLTPQLLSFLDNPDPEIEVKNLHLRTDLGPLDVLTAILGVGDFQRVHEKSLEIDLFGRRCRVMSLDDLIRTREAMGCEKGLLAAKELRAIREKAK